MLEAEAEWSQFKDRFYCINELKLWKIARVCASIISGHYTRVLVSFSNSSCHLETSMCGQIYNENLPSSSSYPQVGATKLGQTLEPLFSVHMDMPLPGITLVKLGHPRCVTYI